MLESVENLPRIFYLQILPLVVASQGGGLASTGEHVEEDDVGEQAVEIMGPRLYTMDMTLT